MPAIGLFQIEWSAKGVLPIDNICVQQRKNHLVIQAKLNDINPVKYLHKVFDW